MENSLNAWREVENDTILEVGIDDTRRMGAYMFVRVKD